MEVKGKVIFDLGERSGTSRAGNAWKVHEYVLETTEDNFPRKIAFDFFGDKSDQYKLSVGDEIVLSFDIDSREYQGRWFTSIRGWKAEPVTATAPAGGTAQPGDFPPPPPAVSADNAEDLPF